MAEGEAPGRDEGEVVGFDAGDDAGFDEGDAPGFGLTSTSAANRPPKAIATVARINQNLNIECLRNAVLALSQDQFLRHFGAGPSDSRLFSVGLVSVPVSAVRRFIEGTGTRVRPVGVHLWLDSALRTWRSEGLL